MVTTKVVLDLSSNVQMNMSPALGIELLSRLLKIIKDYCGMLTEEAVRKNFALIYELLDEAIVGRLDVF